MNFNRKRIKEIKKINLNKTKEEIKQAFWKIKHLETKRYDEINIEFKTVENDKVIIYKFGKLLLPNDWIEPDILRLIIDYISVHEYTSYERKRLLGI